MIYKNETSKDLCTGSLIVHKSNYAGMLDMNILEAKKAVTIKT